MPGKSAWVKKPRQGLTLSNANDAPKCQEMHHSAPVRLKLTKLEVAIDSATSTNGRILRQSFTHGRNLVRLSDIDHEEWRLGRPYNLPEV